MTCVTFEVVAEVFCFLVAAEDGFLDGCEEGRLLRKTCFVLLLAGAVVVEFTVCLPDSAQKTRMERLCGRFACFVDFVVILDFAMML